MAAELAGIGGNAAVRDWQNQEDAQAAGAGGSRAGAMRQNPEAVVDSNTPVQGRSFARTREHARALGEWGCAG
jgi:hypothetical protein